MKRLSFLGSLGSGVAATCINCTVVAAAEGVGAPPHWTYSGDEGPAHWGQLSPAYKTCSIGLQQSPIDIRSVTRRNIGTFTTSYADAPLAILNNGHTVQVNYAPGSSLSMDGIEYKVLQFHFHTPSEHTYNGAHYPMELHIVHADEAKNLAVIGIFLKPGAANPELQKVLLHLPKSKGPQAIIPGITINATKFLPKNLAYFRYMGSLTTPPCSEKVKWTVLKTPVTVAPAQIAAFTSLFPLDARPVQTLHGRAVLENAG